jgi:hypothetical protein
MPAASQPLASLTAANAPVWGGAALALAAAATAYALAEKERKQREAQRANQAKKAAQAATAKSQGAFAGHLSDAQVMAQIQQAGGDPNMSIAQARVIVHNAYVGSQIKPPKPPAKTGSQRALQAELTDAGGMDVAGGAAVGIDGPSRAEIEAQIASQKANAAWAARYQGLADNPDMIVDWRSDTPGDGWLAAVWEPVRKPIDAAVGWIEDAIVDPVIEVVNRARSRVSAVLDDVMPDQPGKLARRAAGLGAGVLAATMLFSQCTNRGQLEAAQYQAAAALAQTQISVTQTHAASLSNPEIVTAQSTSTPTPEVNCSFGYCTGESYVVSGGVNVRDAAYGNVIGNLGCGYEITMLGNFIESGGYVWAEVGIFPKPNINQSNYFVAVFDVKVNSPIFDDSDPQCLVSNSTNLIEGEYYNVNGELSVEEKELIISSGELISNRFFEALGNKYSQDYIWNRVFYNPFTFEYKNKSCNDIGLDFSESGWDCWGIAFENEIWIANDYLLDGYSSNQQVVEQFTTHEIAHVFDRRISSILGLQNGNNPGTAFVEEFGLTKVNNSLECRQSTVLDGEELFADAFMTWVLDDCDFSDSEFETQFNQFMSGVLNDMLP